MRARSPVAHTHTQAPSSVSQPFWSHEAWLFIGTSKTDDKQTLFVKASRALTNYLKSSKELLIGVQQYLDQISCGIRVLYVGVLQKL